MKREKLENFEVQGPANMAKTRYEAMLRFGVSFDVKLGRTIQNNVLNIRARFRCVSHSCRAATARIAKFFQNFIDALRRDARG